MQISYNKVAETSFEPTPSQGTLILHFQKYKFVLLSKNLQHKFVLRRISSAIFVCVQPYSTTLFGLPFPHTSWALG